ncbi:SDR family oxidoreductase [Branchiibius sp. NY16-3462-2]|uniref:SDR family oxidoreductase n=1 Tax=Branchiibius sp. NY16-3462-2 TaxID=1807500 RepID=UPI00079C9EDC|nr:SDR family oxidoreductase [Branchiibius sp. NY16-3462-2]KYH44662.1 3-beta hydroxysteroid dehydrogenase [Branchiibius sp. NY16-3462-2]
MHIFMTGASGWIGSAVVPELLAAGHTVTAMARSATSADTLRAAGVEPIAADLDDLAALRSAAENSDGVVHLANKHDWSNPAESNRAERAAVDTFGAALAGSDRPLLIASGTAIPMGRPLVETDRSPFSGPDSMRGGSEALAMDYAGKGVRSVAVRFAPTVHGTGGDHGFIALIARGARAQGFAAYPGDGSNRWSAVHRADAGQLVALAVESAPAGSVVHAVAEEGITSRSIAEALGAALDLPTQSQPADVLAAELGFVGRVFAMDLPASSAITRERFNWTPSHPTLEEDIVAGAYPG